MKFTTIIVEDEIMSRDALSSIIAEIPWLKIVGEAGSVKRAIDLINEHKPDVLFLDIKMPGGTGLDILNNTVSVPNIIFTTAYGEFAVDAFEQSAVDYLLKPYSQKRLYSAFEKLRSRLFDKNEAQIFVKSGNKVLPFTLGQVEYFSADKDYVIAHSGEEEQLLTTTLSALEEQLDAEQYIRIHRSIIVNVHMIKSMQRHGDRQYKIIMKNNSEIMSSKAGTAKLKQFIR
ncbi:MAG: LytTR family DNA-binding domain-containing protein [Emcibacteraceae bacterium]|nr:LytTR family DNA-binding domain-containing protein [Emcibacteraceae bacterium]MDG1857508.1 LytTR family DNA-binding domain-containing protein [Emcibacteraceae bacterium]